MTGRRGRRGSATTTSAPSGLSGQTGQPALRGKLELEVNAGWFSSYSHLNDDKSERFIRSFVYCSSSSISRN